MYLQIDPFAPDLTPARKKLQIDFFEEYSRQHIGLAIQFCDYAFFPTGDGVHWFLFVVDLNAKKVSILDSLREERDMPLRERAPEYTYIMVTSQ